MHQYKFMKQNQSLTRFAPGQKSQLKHHDFLTLKAPCTCAQCENITQTINPEISLDQDLIRLKSTCAKTEEDCDFIFFLNQIRRGGKNLPKLNFLDTVVLKGGEGYYAIHFQEGKLKVTERINAKNWVLERKQYRDLQYQIKKHQREYSFHFTAFEHKCEKKIKQFQNNIKYKIPTVLNRTAIIKLRRQQQEVVLSKNEYENLFDATKHRAYELEDIQYIQVFPIMNGEEERSYIKTIKYFREKEHKKKNFKLAEMYVSTWLERNDSLEKLEEGVYDEIRQSNQTLQITEEDKLFYQSYKLLLYFEDVSDIRIEQAVLHFYTNDEGQTFFFKSLECLKIERRASVQEIGIQLPTKRDIHPQDYINLRSSMQKLFEGFQRQYERLDKQREQMQNKLKKDKEYSNMVFRTLSDRRGEDLHQILANKNLKYKKSQLNL